MENENRNSRISNMNDFVNADTAPSRRVAPSVRTGSTTQSSSASSRVRTVSADDFNDEPRRTPSQRPSGQPRRKKKVTKAEKANKLLSKVLIGYTALLLIAVIVAAIILNSFLKSVADGEPTKLVDVVCENFKSTDKLKDYIKNDSKVKSNKSIIGFEDKYYELVDGKEITYMSNENTETTQSYYIQADKKNVALVSLKVTDKKGAFGVERWEVESVDTTVAFSDVKAYSILVPEGSTVYVNGTLLDADCITGTGVPEILQNSIQYIQNPPQFVTYTAKTLTDEIIVSGQDKNGLDLTFSETANSFVAGGKADQAFIDSVKKIVEAGLKEYALYFIHESFSLPLYIVENCKLHEYIFGSDEYNPIDPNLYLWEYIDTVTFEEFEAKNYTKYGDNCFTVDVHYVMRVKFDGGPGGQQMNDDVHELDATWVWVPDRDSWSISDSIVH